MSLHACIRSATLEDAAELARLISLLGYAVTADGVAGKWGSWCAEGNLALVVPGEALLLGAVTLHRMVVLHRPQPVARITSLVVDGSVRGRGHGRALVEAAEEAMHRAGCGLLEITSHARFADAHAFNRHLGYEQSSLRFAKVL